MPRFDAVASVTREDIELRRKAAQIADIDEAGLPNVQDLKGVTHWLFGVLAREGDTEISAAKLIVACKLLMIESLFLPFSLDAFGFAERKNVQRSRRRGCPSRDDRSTQHQMHQARRQKKRDLDERESQAI